MWLDHTPPAVFEPRDGAAELHNSIVIPFCPTYVGIVQIGSTPAHVVLCCARKCCVAGRPRTLKSVGLFQRVLAAALTHAAENVGNCPRPAA
jgi:hypothetical protein